jgi:predicted nucleic acid-binding protein
VRVILDTNVFISGILFSGPPHEMLEARRDRKVGFVASAHFGIDIVSPRRFVEDHPYT